MTVSRSPLAAAGSDRATSHPTGRRPVERKIRDLADRYDALTSTTTDAFWEVDPQGRILSVNDEACRMSGYARDELLALSIRDLEATQTPREIRQILAQVAASGQTRFQSRHRRKDGSVIDVEVSTTTLPGAGTFLAFIRDVTERTRAQARLQELLEFNHTILASLVDQIVILDREGTILAINDAWERSALERGGPDFLARCGVGASYLEACRKAEDWSALEGIESVLRRRRDLHRSEYPAQGPIETRWYLMEVMPLRRAEGGAVVVHRDITVNKRAQAELEQLRAGNWHAHRVAQVGAIVASLAHELNQPLAAILGNAQAGTRLMASPEPDLDEIRAILADIVNDDKRAAAVIAGLRAMLRRKETQREQLDLAALVRQGLVLIRSELIAHGAEVELRAAPGSFVSADSAQVEQVILNLVMNAVEAMDGLPAQRRKLTITLGPAATDEVVLAIRDRGPGVPKQEQAKLFSAFWTTKKHGMGVGLPICRSIIESHGGHLWFANNEGEGATFFVSLPASPPPGRGR